MEINQWVCDVCKKSSDWFSSGWIEAKSLRRHAKNKSIDIRKEHYCGVECLASRLAFRKTAEEIVSESVKP